MIDRWPTFAEAESWVQGLHPGLIANLKELQGPSVLQEEESTNMHTQSAVPERIRLYLPDLDDDLRIENDESGVVIRTTNHLSDEKKEHLLRRLAAEGYIPDQCQWLSEPGVPFVVRWIAGRFSEGTSLGNWLRPWCSARKVLYASLCIAWLALFIWAAQHTAHGL